MNILVACEESQHVCEAFRKRGHRAFSCDIIEPSGGHPYSKKTCLWLRGLPILKPTKTVEPICSWVSGGSKDSKGNKRTNCGMKFRDAKTKSKTFPGVAKAMAEQWG
jgi:hypothetical protein